MSTSTSTTVCKRCEIAFPCWLYVSLSALQKEVAGPFTPLGPKHMEIIKYRMQESEFVPSFGVFYGNLGKCTGKNFIPQVLDGGFRESHKR